MNVREEVLERALKIEKIRLEEATLYPKVKDILEAFECFMPVANKHRYYDDGESIHFGQLRRKTELTIAQSADGKVFFIYDKDDNIKIMAASLEIFRRKLISYLLPIESFKFHKAFQPEKYDWKKDTISIIGKTSDKRKFIICGCLLPSFYISHDPKFCINQTISLSGSIARDIISQIYQRTPDEFYEWWKQSYTEFISFE